MFSIIKNKKRHKTIVQNIDHDRIAKAIVARYIRLQQRWATYMQHQSERLSVKWKVIALALFCICTGGFSLTLMVTSLISNNVHLPGVSRIKISTNIYGRREKKTRANVIVTEKEYNKIVGFKAYMDSLTGSTAGRRSYDSILMNRPGLMDSITFIENIYQSQIKH